MSYKCFCTNNFRLIFINYTSFFPLVFYSPAYIPWHTWESKRENKRDGDSVHIVTESIKNCENPRKFFERSTSYCVRYCLKYREKIVPMLIGFLVDLTLNSVSPPKFTLLCKNISLPNSLTYQLCFHQTCKLFHVAPPLQPYLPLYAK